MCLQNTNERCVFIWNSFLKQKCELCLVESIKRVLKAKTILGCDVSKEDNVNLFFFKRYSESFLNRRTRVSIANIGI